MKQDITEHSDAELSLIVMNDEPLYRERRRIYFKANLEEIFKFRDEQLLVLKQDLINDCLEDGLDPSHYWFGDT